MKFLRVFVFVICIFAISKADPAKLIYNTYLIPREARRASERSEVYKFAAWGSWEDC